MNNQNNNYQVVYQEVEEKSLIDLIKLLVKHKIFILTLTIIGFIVGLIGFVIYEKRKPMQMEQKFYLTYMDRMTQMEVAGVPVAPDLAFKDNDFIDMLLDDDYIKKGISSKDNKIRRGYIQGKLSVRQDDPKNNKNLYTLIVKGGTLEQNKEWAEIYFKVLNKYIEKQNRQKLDKEYQMLNRKTIEYNNNLGKLEKTIKISSKNNNQADFFVENGFLRDKFEEILEIEKLSLKGKHNLENVMFIVATAKTFGISTDIIKEYLYNTESLEHRMEDFLKVEGVTFINDSKGTNIDSTIKAIEAYKEKPILICGGKDKHVDLKPLAEVINKSVKALYLIGDTADKIEELVVSEGYEKNKIYNLKTIENVLDKIKFSTGDIILFSPAHSSFDQFKNYVERGRIFKELVNKKFGNIE